MKKFLALALSCSLALTALAGCSGSGTGSGSGTPGSSAPESGDKVVTIGIFEPASGDNGAGGKQEVLGMKYAHDVQPTVEIGGETYQVELAIVDNQSSNDKAATAASELVSKGCSVVLGSYGSGVSIAGSDTFKTPVFPSSASPARIPRSPRGIPTISAFAFWTHSKAPFWPTLPWITLRPRPLTP